MPTLIPLDPFEPPKPQRNPRETAAIVVGGIALVALNIATGFVLFDALTILGAVVGICYWLRDRGKPVPEPSRELVHVPRSMLGDGDGNVACTRCKAIVPYATMSLNEHGSFCAPCAAGLRAA